MNKKTEEQKEDPLFQLDTVLMFLYKGAGIIHTIKHVTKDVSKEIDVDGNDVFLILKQLEADNYIDEYSISDPDDNRLTPKEIKGYSINFNGKLFLKQGGYKLQAINNVAENSRLKKLEIDQVANQKKMTFLTIAIAVGTLVAAVYYIIEICNRFSPILHIHHLYWIWETIPKKPNYIFHAISV